MLLDVDVATLRERLAHRHGHFMPASLLDSQLATLEPPTCEADALIVDGCTGEDAAIATVLHWLAERYDDSDHQA